MDHSACTITVFFEDPFWVGLYERSDGKGRQVCKLTFGAEPKDHQVYQLLLARWRELKFSPAVQEKRRPPVKRSPTQERKAARKTLQGPPVGTKAQEALKLQHQEGKEARRARSRQEKEADALRRFQLRREKKQKKHRGH